MIVATWNLERLKRTRSKEKTAEVIATLNGVNADVLIVTETDSVINLKEMYTSLPSHALPVPGDSNYKQGENRTTIWCKTTLNPAIDTYDPFTTVCTSIETRLGKLTIYGTVIGRHGNRRKSFMNDLEGQICDWQKICDSGVPICIAGDFNLSFHDSYYFTKAGRNMISDFFKQNEITILTCGVKDNIDHIAISNSFLETIKFTVNPPWNLDKKLSDHIGVSVTLDFSN